MIVKYEFDGDIVDFITSKKRACEYAHDERYKLVNELTWYSEDDYNEGYEPDKTEKIYEYKETDVNFKDCVDGKYDFCIVQLSPRSFVIKDKNTGETLDDAKGNGYMTEEKAFNGYRYKCCRGFMDPSKNYIFKEYMSLDELIEKGKSFKEINEIFKHKSQEER